MDCANHSQLTPGANISQSLSQLLPIALTTSPNRSHNFSQSLLQLLQLLLQPKVLHGIDSRSLSASLLWPPLPSYKSPLNRVSQNYAYIRTYIRCILDREITIHTVIYGENIQFWPALPLPRFLATRVLTALCTGLSTAGFAVSCSACSM